MTAVTTSRNSVLRAGLVVPGITLAMWVAAGPALAHTELVSSSPSAQQVLTDPPAQVLLVFNEPVQPALSRLTVTGPRGVQATVGAISHGRHGKASLRGTLSAPLPAGSYRVDWRTVSSDDGHPSSGSYSFRMLNARTVPAAAQPPPVHAQTPHDGIAAAVYGVSRWLAFVGFVALVGGLYFLVACWPQARSRRAWRLQVAGGWGALVLATVAMLVSYGAYVTGAPAARIADFSLLGTTMSSQTGMTLATRLALLLALALAAYLLRRSVQPPGGSSRALVLTVGALLAATWSATSHSESSAHPGSLVVLDVMHLVAAAVWLGGLAALGLAGLRETGARDETRNVVSRFSSIAVIAVGVLVGTGCIQAWQQLGSLSALGDSRYARLLLFKVGLVALAVLLAGVVRFRLLRSRQWRLASPSPPVPRLRRLVLAETAIGVAVLTITSLLVSSDPARASHPGKPAPVVAATSASRPTPQPVYGQVAYDAGIGKSGQGAVVVAVDPPAVGPSSIHLTVLDQAGTPRRVTTLTGLLRRGAVGQSPTVIRFTRLGQGHYVSAGVTFPTAGAWQLGIGFLLPSSATATSLVSITVR